MQFPLIATCPKPPPPLRRLTSSLLQSLIFSSPLRPGPPTANILLMQAWDFEKGTCETTLNGHKGAVTVLRYNKLGSLLASGSKDNDVILWDVVGETGLFRLRGHRDQVTDIVFLDSGKKLVSSSKDKFLRVWDLETQHCMQIVGGHHSEIWSIDVVPEERFLVTGSADPELRFYSVKHEMEAEQSVDDVNGNEVGMFRGRNPPRPPGRLEPRKKPSSSSSQPSSSSKPTTLVGNGFTDLFSSVFM